MDPPSPIIFDHPWIIAIGIAEMSYGDGLASLIGEKYGKRKYNILGDPKSVEGSLAMFITLLITLPLVLFYYQKPVTWPIIFAIAATATIIEAPDQLIMNLLCWSLVQFFESRVVYYEVHSY